MKKIIIITIILLLTSCSIFEPDIVDAQISITSYTQEYYSSLGRYGLVYVYYDIRNTGNKEISYYEATFKAKTSTTSYGDWDNGSKIGVGLTKSDYTIINTSGKKCTGVDLVSKELKSY